MHPELTPLRPPAHPPRPATIYGLGIIGSRVAARCAAHGIATTTWNRTPKPDAPGFTPDLATAASRSTVHQIFTRDETAVETVIAGILPALGPGHTVLIHATVPKSAVLDWHRRVAATGAALLDAPFTGSRNAAEAGNLVYYIGGNPGDIDAVRANLLPSCKELLPLGMPGDAAVLKIATNMVTAAIVQALAEALAVARAGGVDPALLVHAIAHNACRSGTSDLKLASMLAGDFSTHFSLANMLKDARFARAIAAAAGLTLPAHEATTAVMERLAARDETTAASDFSVLASQWDPSPAE